MSSPGRGPIIEAIGIIVIVVIPVASLTWAFGWSVLHAIFG